MRKLAVVALLGLAPLTSGCGAVLQTVYGFEEEAPRRASRTRTVRIEGLPAGAVVERRDAIGTVRLATPHRDQVTFMVDETVSVPTSRWPLWVGTGLDVATLTTIFAATDGSDDGGTILRLYGILYVVPSIIADGIFALLYSFDDEERVERFSPAGPATTTYIAYANGEIREITIDVAWQDRVVFDFSATEGAPGGPRLP